MAATLTTRSSTSLLCYTVIITFIASLILSVDAIRCHQCNSLLNEDCTLLRLSIPRAPVDNHYLSECEHKNNVTAFCRKTVISIDFSGERRIVRGCGWIPEERTQLSCFDADAEGLKQTICACYSDACNAATPRLGGGNQLAIFGLAAFCILVATVLRRSA